MTTTPARMHQRRRTYAQWASENPVLAAGEIGIATGTIPMLKVGDGTTTWANLRDLLIHVEEDFSFGAAAMRTTATLNTGNNFPRYTLPDGVTTSVFLDIFNFPKWYKATDVHVAWVNDHTATGNVRLRTILREIDAATEAITGGATISDVTFTSQSFGANGGTGLAVSVASVTLNPGAFGSFYTFEFQRIGGDGADTLTGPIGLSGIGFLRKEI